MHILFIHPLDINYPGGGETWLKDVTLKLARKGHKIDVLCTKFNPLGHTTQTSQHLQKESISVRFIKSIKLIKGSPLIEVSPILEKAEDADIIYLTACPPNEVPISILKKYSILSTPVIAGFHALLDLDNSILHKLYTPIYVKCYQKLEALHVLNRYSYNLFINRFKTSPNKVFYIPNGVDASVYKIQDPSDNVFRVLFTGRLEYEKGADILHKTIVSFNSKYPELTKKVEFVITGTGSYSNYFEQLSRRYNNVKYLGYIRRESLTELYSECYLYLIPSRQEAMPLRILEAMASGLLIVGSKIPGIIDVVPNIFCKLIGLENIEGYCKAIVEYYTLWENSFEEYVILRRKLRKYTMLNYDWERITPLIENMFTRVLLE